MRDGIERVRKLVRIPGNGVLRIAVKSRWLGVLIRECGSCRCHEPQESHRVSEQPIDADYQAVKALCCWLYDRFWGGAGEGARRSIPFQIVVD